MNSDDEGRRRRALQDLLADAATLPPQKLKQFRISREVVMREEKVCGNCVHYNALVGLFFDKTPASRVLLYSVD